MQESSLQPAGKSWESSGKVSGKTGTIQIVVDRQFTFGQVRFDSSGTGELWHDGNVARLTPRAAAVLLRPQSARHS